MCFRAFLLAAAVIFSGSIAAAQLPTTRSNSAPPAALPDLQNIITHLSSDDFNERESAQKLLETITWRDLPMLKLLAAAVPDAEAKSRLFTRVEAIEAQLAVNPQGISLQLNNASYPEMVDALEKATGVSFNDSARRGLINPALRYTLSADEQPFWEVLRDLSQQHGLQLSEHGGMSMYQAEPGICVNGIAPGLVAFDALTSPAEPGNAGPRARSIVQYRLALDPRIKVAKFKQPHLTHVVDDAGNVLLDQDAHLENQAWNFTPGESIGPAGEALSIARGGKTIASAKGEFSIAVQLAAESRTIADIENNLRKPLYLAGENLAIYRLEFRDDTLFYSISRQFEQTAFTNQTAPPATFTILDAAGRVVLSDALSAGFNDATVPVENIKPPLKVQFTVTTKTKEILIPYEFKNVPLNH